MLVVEPVTESFFAQAHDGDDPEFTGDDERIVIGTIDAPELAIQQINQIVLFDPDGVPIPLTIERSSLYSEFDDGYYNVVRFLFRVPEPVLETGGLRVVWGDEISANNTQVEQISKPKRQTQF